MANTTPTQERVVDPFASYGSNVVNRLTQIVTHDSEGMLTVPSLQVEQDSTSPNNSVVVLPGYVIKDDVLIRITEEHLVDFTDDDNWYSPINWMTFTGGYCYLVLQYQYLKQRPAPEAKILILQPDERSELDTNTTLLLLKVVRLDSSSPFDILSLYDYDPNPGYEQNERKYIKYYAGGVTNIPTFDQSIDQGRIAYESQRDKFFFGHLNEWRELTAGGVSVNITTDSTGVFIGQLCYVNSIGIATPAISQNLYECADFVVTAIGTASAGTGRGIVCGYGEGVPVETGITIGVGDILYLSAAEAGTVTNERPEGLFQVVGRSLSSGNSSNPVDMIFSPKIPLAPSVFGNFDTWALDGITGLYYHDIDVSLLDGTSVFDCHWFDEATRKEVTPADVEIRNGGDVVRVYFSINTLSIDYMIQSPTSFGGGLSGGGSGGTSDHSLLLNLDFASSGHTGFAPTPHDNTHHSQTYITSSAVNFTNLNGNGSVGTGGSQVAFGNHTHPTYIDIPSGEIILFEKDTAVSGYSLLTSVDDGVVYVTKGSGAGGDAGGSYKSGGTWTQPNHYHSVSSQANHNHTTGSHTLTTSELPAHAHTITGSVSTSTFLYSGGGGLPAIGTPLKASGVTSSVGSGSGHSHGNTGNAGSHDHGGATGNSATVNTWRPRGRNFTRQQRT
jgi:hypothetical protein